MQIIFLSLHQNTALLIFITRGDVLYIFIILNDNMHRLLQLSLKLATLPTCSLVHRVLKIRHRRRVLAIYKLRMLICVCLQYRNNLNSTRSQYDSYKPAGH